MLDHTLDRDWLDKYLLPSLAWIMWLLPLGCLSVSVSWVDKRTKVQHEYTIPGLIR
jgi:hypothetical protein